VVLHIYDNEVVYEPLIVSIHIHSVYKTKI